MPVFQATEISIDTKANTLRIPLPSGFDAAALAGIGHGVLDIGSSGRLIGLELGPLYLSVMDAEAGHEDLVRSADVPVTISSTGSDARSAVTFKRAGSSYEITCPSGNQCWTRHNILDERGKPMQTCSIIIEKGTISPRPRIPVTPSSARHGLVGETCGD